MNYRQKALDAYYESERAREERLKERLVEYMQHRLPEVMAKDYRFVKYKDGLGITLDSIPDVIFVSYHHDLGAVPADGSEAWINRIDSWADLGYLLDILDKKKDEQ